MDGTDLFFAIMKVSAAEGTDLHMQFKVHGISLQSAFQ
jgi:hypothetical protein